MHKVDIMDTWSTTLYLLYGHKINVLFKLYVQFDDLVDDCYVCDDV